MLFWSKIPINLSLGLQKGSLSYRRSHQPSKKEHPALQNMKFRNLFTFSVFLGPFCPPGSGSSNPNYFNSDPCGSGSETLDLTKAFAMVQNSCQSKMALSTFKNICGTYFLRIVWKNIPHIHGIILSIHLFELHVPLDLHNSTLLYLTAQNQKTKTLSP